MNNIQIFPSKEFGQIRTILIKGTEYFFGVDIATALEYKRPRKAVTDNCKGVLTEDTIKNGGGYPEPLIPIGDIYRLIVKASSQSNNEEIKEKAERFERLVFDTILPEIHKTGGYGAPKTVPEQIQLLAQGNVELNQRVDGLEERFNKFEQELPMLPDDADEVHDCLNKRVVFLLGGKDSSAYRNKSLSRKVFMDAYRTLKYNFDVRRYKAIKRSQKSQALKIIAEYKPPLFLQGQIDMANSQQSLDLKGGMK